MRLKPSKSSIQHCLDSHKTSRMIIKLDIFEWTSPQIFAAVFMFLEYFQWEFPFTIINIYILDTLTIQYLQLIRFRRFLFPYFATFRICTYANIIFLFGLSGSRFYLFFVLPSILLLLQNCMYYLHKFYKEILKVGKWNWWTDF